MPEQPNVDPGSEELRGHRPPAGAGERSPRSTGQNLEEHRPSAGVAERSPGSSGRSQADQIAVLEDRLLRTLADLDNVRKRAAQQVESARAEERAEVAAKWLPVLDNLDLALAHSDANPVAIISGVEAVRDQALSVLAQLGFPRRSDRGLRFDPARHEAVAAVPDAATPGTVLEVVRPGYGDGTHLLRPAAVVVSKEDDGGQD